jgi:hypothetical protein
VEGDLHVEVPHPTDGGDDVGQVAAPLGLGERLVVAHDDARQGLVARANGLLQHTSPMLVL